MKVRRLLLNCVAVLLMVGSGLMVSSAVTPECPVSLSFFGEHQESDNLPVASTPYAVAATSVWHLYHGTSGGSAVAYHSLKDGGMYRTLWITAKHCVDSEAHYGVLYPHNDSTMEIAFYVVSRHPVEDVAILETTTGFPIATVVLNKTGVSFGEKVFVAGWSLGISLYLKDGYQAAAIDRCSCTAIPGDSGGAVLNEKGELLGITVACASSVYPFRQLLSNMTRYVPIVVVSSWLRAYTITTKG